MTRLLDSLGRHPRTAAAIALLAGTVLGGGTAYAVADVAGIGPLVPVKAAAAAAPATPATPLHLPPVYRQAGFSALVAKVKPAVVNIATSEMPRHTGNENQLPQVPPDFPFPEMFRHFFDQQNARPEHALGSGFIIDPAGYIVTNNHVVDGARKITVTLENGSSYPAKVIGRDAKTDLALLKIHAGKPLPYVSWGASGKEQVGDWVIAVGNPFGLGGTVTAGIVSAYGRNINEGPYDDFLQIDAPINPGNSGGPLFNQSGGVIGIDTAIYSPNGGSVGIGFAIPSDLASKVVAQLRAHGKVERGWLGIQMQPVTNALAKAVGLDHKEGVLVDQVMDDSPASRAGLKQGDVIVTYDGKAIETPRDLAMDVADDHSGQKARLGIWRNGHSTSINVKIGSQDNEKQASANDDATGGKVGMALAPLNADERAQLGLGPSAHGVVVAQVTPDSRADDSGIQPGDVLERVGSAPVFTPGQVVSRIHAAERAHKQAIPLLVLRNGTTYYVALKLAQG